MRRLLPVWFPNNAIMRAERSHQGRAITTQRKWRRYVQRAVNWFMLTIGMILFWGEVAGALTKRDASPIGQKLGVLTVIFVAYVVIWHFSLMFRTLALSANSIAREKQSGSWDLLVLTGVDARQIVRGKWWATIQQQFPHYVQLGVLRACAAVYWTANNGSSLFFSISFVSRSVTYPEYPEAVEILMAGVIIFILTLANLLFTVACGVQASSRTQRPSNALVWAIIARITVPLLPVISFALASFNPLSILPFNALTMIIGNATIGLLDNGISTIYDLVTTHYHWRPYIPFIRDLEVTITVLVTMILTMGFYILFTVLLLRRAERSTVQKSGASPAQTRFASNYKQVTL